VESIVIAGRRFECDADDSGEITLSGLKNEARRSGAGGKRLVTDGVKLIYKGIGAVSASRGYPRNAPVLWRFRIGRGRLDKRRFRYFKTNIRKVAL
jgi:hypothetical protein